MVQVAVIGNACWIRLDKKIMTKADWTEVENGLIVADYFEMLSKELTGANLNKSEHRRELIKSLSRSEGSVERKHQNISAVLKALGERWIDGYKPLFNYQTSLEDAVFRWLTANPDWAEATSEAAGLNDLDALFMEAAPTLRNSPPPDELERTQRTARKFNVAGRDERNRRLGLAGERRVLAHEQSILRSAGRPDLAARVDWVSQTQGDGTGYDISSFEPNGNPRLIEVKTTNGWERTPFHITRNELEVAREQSDCWRLVRLWDFSRKNRAFELRPPLERHVSLMPTSFQATFDG